MELNIRLDPNGQTHLYEQIYEYIRDEIRRGELLGGEKLPSSRALASFLHISRSTAQQAYDQLALEGYITMKKNSGAYVCDISNLLDISNGATQQKTRKEKALDIESVKLQESKPDMIDFSPRKIDMSIFPYATWRRILRGLMAYTRADMFTRGDPQGDMSLRKTIARYLHLSRGVDCTAEQIIIGAGNDYLLLMLKYILGDGRQIAMENPTYLRAYEIFRALEYDVIPIASDESGMRSDELLTSVCDVAYVMPAHQYPTGILMPYPRRLELISWAQGADQRYIIEDDYDSEFKYRGKPVHALQSMDRQGKVIYIGSFSKSIAPAIRVSFMVLPEPLLEQYHRHCGFLSSTVSRIDQSVLEEFIRDGYFERHLNRMRNRYRAKHDLMLQCLQPMRKYFEIGGEDAGLHLTLTAKRKEIGKEQELTALARENGVIVYPLHAQMIPGSVLPKGQENAPQFLLGYAALEEDQIRQGIEILRSIWGDEKL